MGLILWTTALLLCSFAVRQACSASVEGISDPDTAEALRADPAIASGDLACAVRAAPSAYATCQAATKIDYFRSNLTNRPRIGPLVAVLQVILQPYRISEPVPTTLRAPTVSLPPDYVTVAINFEVIDQGSQDFAKPWLLRWFNPEYLQVLQVGAQICTGAICGCLLPDCSNQ